MKGSIKGGSSIKATKVTGRGRRRRMAHRVFNDSTASRGLKGGAAIPVIAIADTDLEANGGTYRLKAGPAIPMTVVTGEPIKGGSARVVYPVDLNGDYDNTF